MEQPYAEVARKFVGRGCDAPARYAREGKRPKLPEPDDASPAISALIACCWHTNAAMRPSFAMIVTKFATDKALEFKDMFDEDDAPQLPTAVARNLEKLFIS